MAYTKNYRRRGAFTRKNRFSRRQKPEKTVVGKIYANWCGHCQNLIPTWNELKQKLGGGNYQFVEVEQQEIDTTNKLAQLRKRIKGGDKNIKYEGFPSLFKIKGGKVSYYSGDRSLESLMQFYKET